MSKAPMKFPPPVNPDDLGRGPLIMGVTWTLTGLAVLATLLRMYIRKAKDKTLASDDWLMFVATWFQVANNIIITVCYGHGLGKHDADIPKPDEFVQIIKWTWIATGPGMAVSVLARISIAILLIRIFGIHTWFKVYLIILTTLQVILGVLIFLMTWTQYKPVTGRWEVFTPSEQRFSHHNTLSIMYLGQAAYTLADVSYVVLPVIIIWNLNMGLRRRIGLILLMGAGVITSILSILKMIYMNGGPDKDPNNRQYAASLTALFAGGEQACVVLLGSVPPLRNLLKVDYPSLRTLGASVSSLFSAQRHLNITGASDSAHHNDKSDDSAHEYDLELNPGPTYGSQNAVYKYKSGGPIVKIDGDGSQTFNADDSGSSRSLVPDGHMRRTDAFTVSYENPNEKQRKA